MEENNINPIIETKPKSKTKIVSIYLFLLIVVCLVSLYIFVPGYFAYIYNTVFKKQDTKIELSIKPIQVGEATSSLPEGIFTEKEATVLSSQKILNDENKEQFNLRYLSAKNISENSKYFDSFFLENKWSVFNKAFTPSGMSSVYVKDNQRITLDIFSTNDLKTSTVDITLENL